MVTVECTGVFPAGITRALVQKLGREAYRYAGGKGGVSVTVATIDDRTMRRLNLRHRGQDKTTDVLSFRYAESMFVDSEKITPLGDIMISVPQVRRQAKRIGRSITQEFSLMIVHGMLHLMGYDHETIADETRMFGLQHDILLRVGIF